jgi:diguanylate cyclase (GGDEF)-like protein
VDYILQLGLNKFRKMDPKKPEVHIVWLIDQLLDVIAENLVNDDADGASFRSQLESLRRDILNIEKIEISKITAGTTIDLCRGQFKKTQTKRMERDEYFAEIILFLRNALATLSGETQTFHDDLLGTTHRISEIIRIEDIRELRMRVTKEVDLLKDTIVEKQKKYKTQIVQLSEQIAQLQQKLEEAKAEASIDGLTGAANRRNFDFTIQRWVIGYEQNEVPFTLVMIDLDNFKHINDTYGHQAGDLVLAETAAILRNNIRGDDFLARYGGEEFVILVAGMKLAESEKRFSELLKHIASHRFACDKSESGEERNISVTASCGISEFAFGESAGDLVRRADEALYEAKRTGKNRVVAKRRSLLSAFYEGRKRNVIA